MEYGSSMSEISFTVFGKAMPKGSKTAIVRGKRAVLLDARRGPARAAFASWKDAVSSQAYAASLANVGELRDIFVAPLEVTLEFFLPKPKSLPKKTTQHVKKPDIDKLVRAALDPMSGILFQDDSQIVSLHASKQYGEPRMKVNISTW